jgi:peptidoglycan/xylan/chitin deacetylase (PgdA/CDA1 family)
MTHPNLTDISSGHLYWEVMESKNVLQNIFKKPVLGFCYPFNAYNESVKAAVKSAGYVWARGSHIQESIFPPHDPLEFHFCCRYPSPDFWPLFNNAKKTNSVFSFWGHSYELLNETMWKSFEETIEKISSDPETMWSFITELFIKE